LEGPEAGVYYRGTSFLDPAEKYREIALPAYADALATEFTVHVTPVMADDNTSEFVTLMVSRVKEGKFKVYREKPKIKFLTRAWKWLLRKKKSKNLPVHFDYIVFAKRLEMNVEPLKTEVTINRIGPYTWL
jgi:hypothetical protein